MTTSPDAVGGGSPARGLGPRFRAALRTFWETLRGGAATPLRTSLALGLGLGIAFALPPGTHTPAALGLAVLLRLNGVVAVAGTLVWQPFTAPFILLAQKRVGMWLLGSLDAQTRPGFWGSWAEPVLVGAPLSALLAGSAGAVVCYGALRGWKVLRGGRPRAGDPGEAP